MSGSETRTARATAPPDLGVAGRTVLVTGAARGLGRAMAEGLAAGGAAVVLVDRDDPGIRSLAESLSAEGRQALAVAGDVTDAALAAMAVRRAVERFGRLDGLVNNAGINQVAPSEQADLAIWRRVLDVNLFGSFVMCQAAARQMLAQGQGSIVNIASIHGHVGPALHPASAYAASKAGLLGLTRALAAEWGRHGIRVNAVSPGFIRTEMTRTRLDDPDYRAGILARSPIREIGEPGDLLGAVFYLLSNASRMVTGQSIGVDAGWLAI
jgi:NAD(P)-dependent dehydrogenase (short-subunit alcohol dehydrogenase family)